VAPACFITRVTNQIRKGKVGEQEATLERASTKTQCIRRPHREGTEGKLRTLSATEPKEVNPHVETEGRYQPKSRGVKNLPN